jgi:Uma2 family endonuclease
MQAEQKERLPMSTDHIYDATTGQPLLSRLPVGSYWGDLNSGDEMSLEEFHRVYEQSPEDFKAELIGGVVYVASPVRISHGQPHGQLGALLVTYRGHTPGVEVCDNTTVILGQDSEVQPDLLLRILPEFGGQTRTSKEDFVDGPPEFVAEVAVTSRSVDLNAKRRQYARYGVREYLVWCVKEQQFRWLDLPAAKELQADADGVIRSRVFPGLWIDGPALLAYDHAKALQTLVAGLATPEHTAFVKQLPSRRSK